MKKRIFVLIFFCYLILIGTSFLRPMIMRNIMDEGIIRKDVKIIITSSVVLVIIIVIEELFGIIQTNLFIGLQNKIILKLYTKVSQTLFYAKIDYFLHNNSAEITNKISTDIYNVSSLADSSIMNMFGYVLQVFSGIAGLLVINWKLALLVLSVVPVKYFLIRRFSKEEESIFEQWIEASADFSAWLGDTVNGIREIKLWNMYEKKQQDVIKKQEKVLELNRRSKLLLAYNNSSDSAVQSLVVAALYGIGGYFICREQLTLGSLTAFISYNNYVIGPISLILNLKIILAQVKPSVQRLKEFFVIETEKKEGKYKEIREVKNKICFKNVTFSYGEKMILRDVNLEISKGEKIAIIGENGSGKSTIISLLLRFIQPQEGNIYVDGVDIMQFDLHQYRNLFSVVNQDIYLFEDTVGNNISLGLQLNENEMNVFCEKMGMKKFINQLSQRHACVIEKNGENLSGGERQKISILRAVIKNSPVFILDEATANIDEKYEKFIFNLFINEFTDKTFIIITHKRENLQGVDRLYQIENQTIKEIKAAD
ncbi:MAG: ABC transporter ATP-binding protein [Dorea sp.]|nr:ABC transporter ATP-binding protein [Dorea sp.]